MENEKLNDVIQKMVSEIEILKEDKDGIKTNPYIYFDYNKPLHLDTGIYFCIEFWNKYLEEEYLKGYEEIDDKPNNYDVVEENMDIIEKMDWKIPNKHFNEEDFYLGCLSLHLEKELFPICNPDEEELLVRRWLRKKGFSKGCDWFSNWFGSRDKGIDTMYPLKNSCVLNRFKREDYSLNRWWEK